MQDDICHPALFLNIVIAIITFFSLFNKYYFMEETDLKKGKIQ